MTLGLLLAATPSAAQQPGIDVQQYTFAVELPDSGEEIRGRAVIEMRRERGAPDTIALDFGPGMFVEEVTDGRTHFPLWFRHDSATLRVRLPLPVVGAPRRDVSVVVRYRGRPRDGLIIRQNARARWSAFGDNWPNRARFWLPTVDHPGDKARVTWLIAAPPGLEVVANGRRRARSRLPSGKVHWMYVEERPIPTSNMVLGATRMTVSRRAVRAGRDSVAIEVWAYPEDSVFADSVPFRRAPAILEALQRLVGPYPYTLLRHVQSSTRFGGMENATTIFYNENSYTRRTMGEGVVRHETAHQWFGDAVTQSDWPHLWLSEGFAVYFGALAGAALDGDSVLAATMRGAAQTVRQSAASQRPVVDTAERDPMRLLNSNAYQKGAWVLHMLRQEVGDTAFFRAVREFYRRYRDGNATSEDFQALVERQADRRLDGFFRQWLYQPGFPRVEVAFSHDSAAGRSTVRVRQVQDAAWGQYRLRIPLRFPLAGGRTLERSFDLEPGVEEQVMSYDLAEPPLDVLVDPEGTLLLEVVRR